MSGIDHANGHRPDGLLDMIHPLLQAAPRPDADELSYDLERALKAVVKLYAEVPADAYTAANLGTEREGSGLILDANGLVLTIEDNYGGGLFSAVAEACVKAGDAFTIEPMHVTRIPKSSRSEAEVLKQCGLDHEAITARAASMLGIAAHAV